MHTHALQAVMQACSYLLSFIITTYIICMHAWHSVPFPSLELWEQLSKTDTEWIGTKSWRPLEMVCRKQTSKLQAEWNMEPFRKIGILRNKRSVPYRRIVGTVYLFLHN